MSIKVDFTYHRVLLGTAEAQLDEAQYPIAILTAQMALEARVATALRNLLSLHATLPAATLLDLVGDRTFMLGPVRALWRDLTGDEIKKAQAWKQYHLHVERRNRLAHGRDEWSSRAEAEASLVAVRDMIGHIEIVEQRVLASSAGQKE